MGGLRCSLAAGLVVVGVFAGWLAGCGSGDPLPVGGGGGIGGTGVGGNASDGGTSGGGGVGGRSSDGGASGGGGAGGSAALPAISGTAVALFDATTEGFVLDDYHDSSSTNLADATAPANPPPTLSFDGSQGSPAPGSLRVSVPFSGANQYVSVRKIIGTATLANWSGRTLHVRIKVSQGTFKGGAQLFVMTTAMYAFGGSYFPLATGSDWQELTLDVSAPLTTTVGYDPRQVVAFGLEPNSSGAGAGSTPVTFNIDSFWVDPPLPPADAGAGDGPGN